MDDDQENTHENITTKFNLDTFLCTRVGDMTNITAKSLKRILATVCNLDSRANVGKLSGYKTVASAQSTA